ncbi:hypothetical protein D3C81_1499460 [compost metagenome]
MPISVLIAVSARANSIDTRVPYSTRASTSRAWSSVPSQLTADGGLGAGTNKS